MVPSGDQQALKENSLNQVTQELLCETHIAMIKPLTAIPGSGLARVPHPPHSTRDSEGSAPVDVSLCSDDGLEFDVGYSLCD